MNLSTLKIGDLIVRQKGPLSTHYLVYVGEHDGISMVAENQSGVGVRYTSLNQALAGNPVKRIEPFGGTEDQRWMVIPRINRILGKAYNLVVFNCEHFARWVSGGKIESRQVKVASAVGMITAVGAVAVGAKLKRNGLIIIGLILFILSLIACVSQTNHKHKELT